MQALLNIAVRAARRAGEVIVRSLNRLESLAVSSKGRNDFVTEVDHAAEQEIIGIIRRHYPQHAFLAEESGRTGEHDTLWIIDTLDGKRPPRIVNPQVWPAYAQRFEQAFGFSPEG